MRLKINHTTEYAYEEPVNSALQQARLRPLDNPMQKVLDWNIVIEGGRNEVSYVDHFGNHTQLVAADAGATSLKITASGEVDTTDVNGVLGKVYGPAPLWLFLQSTALTQPDDAVRALVSPMQDHSDRLTDMHALSDAIRTAVVYATDHTYAETTAAQALAGGRGVCQDHAQIFVCAARLLGVPARYVSGYLMMDDRVDQDATHAWAEAHIDGLGWVGFDISNGISPDERYVRVASGLDYTASAPLSGVRTGGATETMHVALQVQQ